MSDHTKLATARVADFLSERGWAGEFVADVLAKNPQHVKINGAHAIELVAAALRAAPEGYVLVPVELALRVEDSLGRFVSDEGWAADDMDTADEFGAMLAARPQGVE